MGTDAGSGEPTVLVVDDEEETADLYADMLADDYAVSTAYSGEEALEVVGSSVDVVLLDRRMPERSGDDVLSELRALEVGCRVIMVTAVQPDLGIVDLDFDDYLVKPVSDEQLHEAVERMLERDNYDERIGEITALASEMATLESKLSIDELHDSTEYAALEDRFEELRSDIDWDDPERDLYPELISEKMRTVFD